MAITLHTEPQEVPEQTELAVGRDRDEFQLMIDREMANLKVATAKAGWPGSWDSTAEADPAKLFNRYVVDKKDAADMKGVIRRAATLLKVEPLFYKNAVTEGGLAVIKFHVGRKTTEKDGVTSYVKDDDLAADGKPTAKYAKAVKEADDAAKADAEATAKESASK